jgi:hypothetical protein
MRPWIKLVENDGKAGYGGGSLPGFVQLMGHGRHKIFWLVDEIRLLFVVQFCMFHIVSFVQLAGHMTKLTLAKAKSRS